MRRSRSCSFAFVFIVAFAGVAGSGNSARAETATGPAPAEARALARVGVDGIAGTGLVELIGASLRAEKPVSRSGALLARVGHLQARSIQNETNELYPLFLAQIGYRYYGKRIYGGIEGGVVVGKDDRGWQVASNGGVTLGAKVNRVDLGISLMKVASGASLAVHLGFDFAAW